MALGSLEITSRPLTVAIDTWRMRQADLGQLKPAAITVDARDRAKSAVMEAIGRTAVEGDEFARIEDKGRPVVAQAERRLAERPVSTDDLSVRFLTPPEITWSGGGVQLRYRPRLDIVL